MERMRAAVGEADESPTPTLDSTARDERRPAMELENACSESLISLDFVFAMVRAGWMNLRISDIYCTRQPRLTLTRYEIF